MIQSLYIRNYILIEELKIEFGRDLHVLTGETGAGKSIILGAIGLIAGERADSNSMMEEEKKCIIELTVDIDESYRDFFKTEDIDFEKETIIRREIKPGGKSRAFINDTPVRLNQLKALTSGLLTIHQQFDTHQIGKEKYQLFILDEFGGHTKLIEAYKAQYRQYNELKKRKKEIETTLTAWNREREFNDFLLQELNELDPSQQDEELEK
ncbi:MAG TPA: AAA family ATPase, partial [Saprospiraceae bacterium]|nr:AAA family ATPase [Saprospiraceae bacterium]